jgi:nitric oxide reductase subunit B
MADVTAAGTGRRRAVLVSSGWVQAALLVMHFGFSILGWLAYGATVDAPPIPARIVDPSGADVFTGDDIARGQEIFLRNGLMEYGSIFGHGGYLGPDYTADYLRRAALVVREQYGGPSSDQARAKTIEDFRTNRYDPTTGTLRFSAAQATAFESAQAYYWGIFSEPSSRYGLRPNVIGDPAEIKQLTAFFGWSAWAAAATRPGEDYS